MKGAPIKSQKELHEAFNGGRVTWNEVMATNVGWAKQISLLEAQQEGPDRLRTAEAFWRDWHKPRHFSVGDMVQRLYRLEDWRIGSDQVFEGRAGLGMVIAVDRPNHELTVLWHVGPQPPKAEWDEFQQLLIKSRGGQRRRRNRPIAWTPPNTDFTKKESMLLRRTPFDWANSIVKWSPQNPGAVPCGEA